MMMILGSLESA